MLCNEVILNYRKEIEINQFLTNDLYCVKNTSVKSSTQTEALTAIVMIHTVLLILNFCFSAFWLTLNQFTPWENIYIPFWTINISSYTSDIVNFKSILDPSVMTEGSKIIFWTVKILYKALSWKIKNI